MKILIIGGTGTLGQELTRQILERDKDADIVCFSRGELAQKHAEMRFPTVKYVVGDVRDSEAVRRAMHRAHTVFHLAAIKHIDIAEKNPLEAVKTNFLGTVNVAEACMDSGVCYAVFSNTDKAILPITVYGYTKALAQDYWLSLNSNQDTTMFSSYLWGNVAASRGSVIPMFSKTLDDERKVYLTDVNMSRFWITIKDAARFFLSTYEVAGVKPMIPPIKGATVIRIAHAVARAKGIKNYSLETIGHRGIEKLYEVLESTHAGCLRSDTCEQYTDEELDMLVRGVL